MKVYKSKGRFNCGPCSFINLIGLKGSIRLENQLAKEGKLKPFKASSYTAFLIWSDKYRRELTVYTASKKMNNKMFKLMFEYEKIPKHLQKKYKEQGTKRFNRLNKKYSSKVKLLRDPIKKLDKLLKEGYKVNVLVSTFYTDGKNVPHWIVAFKKQKNKYYFMDSSRKARKITILSKKELEKALRLNKQNGYNPVLISYKK